MSLFFYIHQENPLISNRNMKLILEQYTNATCRTEITSDLVYVQQIQCNSSPGKAYIMYRGVKFG
jgi:hypothetical protein